jgi:hypothetical protein
MARNVEAASGMPRSESRGHSAPPLPVSGFDAHHGDPRLGAALPSSASKLPCRSHFSAGDPARPDMPPA